jgi:RimJ/RimL family protein N-acetyltransferase
MTFVAPDVFETPDFTLRCYGPHDGPALCKATNSSFEHLRHWMPWATNEQTEEQAEELVRQFRAKWLLAQDFVVATFAPDGSELLGGCGFHLRGASIKSGSADIGMWVAGSQAGRGLGTAMLGAMLAWGFTEWPWERLAWQCDVRNAGSRRVAEKNGLRHEGTLLQDEVAVDGGRRDTALFAILKTEWEAREPS